MYYVLLTWLFKYVAALKSTGFACLNTPPLPPKCMELPISPSLHISSNWFVFCQQKCKSQFVQGSPKLILQRSLICSVFKWVRMGELKILWEGSLFTGWGAAYYRNPYNSRESPYLRLIFTQHTIWPLRNPKILTVQFRSPPLMTCPILFASP